MFTDRKKKNRIAAHQVQTPGKVETLITIGIKEGKVEASVVVGGKEVQGIFALALVTPGGSMTVNNVPDDVLLPAGRLLVRRIREVESVVEEKVDDAFGEFLVGFMDERYGFEEDGEAGDGDEGGQTPDGEPAEPPMALTGKDETPEA